MACNITRTIAGCEYYYAAQNKAIAHDQAQELSLILSLLQQRAPPGLSLDRNSALHIREGDVTRLHAFMMHRSHGQQRSYCKPCRGCVLQ
jgi:hypothetical protein